MSGDATRPGVATMANPVQAAGSVLMVRPAHFGWNAETHASNRFQRDEPQLARCANERAREEFDLLNRRLRAAGIDVSVASDLASPVCPDAVFRSIGIAHEHTPDDGTPFTRLLVGDRLLIYLVQSCARAATPDTLTALARQGRAERDAKPRVHDPLPAAFRLVLVSHDPAADAAARTTFETTLGHDDKAHLHVVPSAEIPLDLECA